ncbi:hypothetical protein Desdi_3218 [Desulfitobacterium dichloroeliminans LMG P-21439]|uniref:Outer membrane protein n=2 Tax=Desulfitobacterium dichloroeliminans TaxID=233055 RepID=L0FBM3_DESDL|nr:hypothetical protein Desdi_3218 [Desulfitobacterium dichloroeliminans LMG P-21439]
MKRMLAAILLVTLILASTTHIAQAAEDTLDIEKAAISSIKNSQILKTNGLRVEQMERNYANTKGQMSRLKGLIPFMPNSFELVKTYVLTPKIFENYLIQLNNGQAVLTNAVRLSAYNEYITLLKADYALQTQSELMNSLYEDFKKARLQQEQGMITESQLRLAEIAYEQIRYNYLSAQNSKDSAYMALNNMMGEDISKQYATLQDYNVIPASEIQPPEEYMEQALANRAEVSNAQSTLDLLEEQYLYGSAEIPTDYEFYKQQQEYEIANAQNNLELARINVQQNIAELYTGLESSMEKMEAMGYLAQQAEQNYQAAQIQYENTMITFIELNDAKMAKAQADINYKNAELDTWVMQVMMDLACGVGFQPTNMQ